MEVSFWFTMTPLPTEPNTTAVAFWKPPPLMVMAPPPEVGPVFGDREATDGQPSAPCSAMARWSSSGAPRPVASSKPAPAGYVPP